MANTYTWITPITDRTSGLSRMQHSDMNRITGNLAWLYAECIEQGVAISGSIISKIEWTNNDIITLAEWTELLTCLTNICNAISYVPTTTPNNQMEWSNINLVETIENNCYEILASYANIPDMNHYVGDKLGTEWLFCGDDFNMGGRYD